MIITTIFTDCIKRLKIMSLFKNAKSSMLVNYLTVSLFYTILKKLRESSIGLIK